METPIKKVEEQPQKEETAKEKVINYIKEKQREYHAHSVSYKVLRDLEVTLPSMFEKEEIVNDGWVSVKMNRIWAMPNKLTFTIKPIKELINRYLKGVIIDPFANSSKLGTVTNDLNPEMDTNYHLDGLAFLKLMGTESADVILYDPPYSITQAAQCYNAFGKDKLEINVANMGYWAACKSEVARVLKPDGVCIICGWSSNGNGIGINRGFEMIELLLVPHGGSKNDTIVTVERKNTLTTTPKD